MIRKAASVKLLMISGAVVMACVLAFKKQSNKLVNPKGVTVSTRFSIPAGYSRLQAEAGSFAEYLQRLSLKENGSLVHYYNGVEKPNKVAAAVLNIDVGAKDLQQCADAVMRLRAEYLLKTKQYSVLHFNFTNGFKADYSKWRSGYRIRVRGNEASWYKTDQESVSYQSFREYMDLVFNYAGTASLSKELKAVSLSQMQIGDVLIRGGSPGHAVIVLDMAADSKTGKKLFMIAQSYMPAQDIHILVNQDKPSISPWYELDVNAKEILTPEWPFTSAELKRFQQP